MALYKYLGTWTYNSIHKTGTEKQKQCLKTAFKYKNACIRVSRLGPDMVDVVQCTWLNVAVPSILNGCEMIPFSDSNILQIERIQSQVAKFALGLPITAPNYCAQTELGWKAFRHALYDRQLKFYFRVLYQNQNRWAHQALLEHLSGAWTSPYLAYISEIRTRLGIFSAPHQPHIWKNLSYQFFLASTNSLLSTLLVPMKRFERLPYVCESKWSTVISEFKLGCERLGNKVPRDGRRRKLLCPVCPDPHPNTGLHLLFSCGSLSALRSETGITTFLTSCALRGLDLEKSYFIFVNGLDLNMKQIDRQSYHERAKCMDILRNLWLTKW